MGALPIELWGDVIRKHARRGPVNSIDAASVMRHRLSRNGLSGYRQASHVTPSTRDAFDASNHACDGLVGRIGRPHHAAEEFHTGPGGTRFSRVFAF
jgi:hypothetical protein